MIKFIGPIFVLGTLLLIIGVGIHDVLSATPSLKPYEVQLPDGTKVSCEEISPFPEQVRLSSCDVGNVDWICSHGACWRVSKGMDK